MTAPNVPALRELLAKADATAVVANAPWRCRASGAQGWPWLVYRPNDVDSEDYLLEATDREFAELVVALVNAAPALLDAYEARERVRVLHKPIEYGVDAGFCSGCEFTSPCPTIRALEADDA